MTFFKTPWAVSYLNDAGGVFLSFTSLGVLFAAVWPYPDRPLVPIPLVVLPFQTLFLLHLDTLANVHDLRFTRLATFLLFLASVLSLFIFRFDTGSPTYHKIGFGTMAGAVWLFLAGCLVGCPHSDPLLERYRRESALAPIYRFFRLTGTSDAPPDQLLDATDDDANGFDSDFKASAPLLPPFFSSSPFSFLPPSRFAPAAQPHSLPPHVHLTSAAFPPEYALLPPEHLSS